MLHLVWQVVQVSYPRHSEHHRSSMVDVFTVSGVADAHGTLLTPTTLEPVQWRAIVPIPEPANRIPDQNDKLQN